MQQLTLTAQQPENFANTKVILKGRKLKQLLSQIIMPLYSTKITESRRLSLHHLHFL
jgi:hypothetical protein